MEREQLEKEIDWCMVAMSPVDQVRQNNLIIKLLNEISNKLSSNKDKEKEE